MTYYVISSMDSGPNAPVKHSLSQPYRELPAILTLVDHIYIILLPHRILHKLDYYGLRSEPLTWIQSFLSHRKQRVLLEGAVALQADVVSEVPQGTLLGPRLFVAFNSDLPDCTASDTRLHTDNALLFGQIKNEEDAALLQQDRISLAESPCRRRD